MKLLDYNTIIDDIIHQIPEIRVFAKNTIEDYGKNNYMFFWRLASYYKELYLKKEIIILKKISDFLEMMMVSWDDRIDTLAVTWFLEWFDMNSSEFDGIKNTFCPVTKQWIENYFDPYIKDYRDRNTMSQ